MRVRLIVAVALLLAVATPVQAKGNAEPFDVRQGREVGRAAATNGINGIYVSPVDGNVYAASVGGDEITVHHPRSGRVLDRIGPERGVSGPDDLFITDDGTMYWTEILTGNVGMLKPDGTFKKQMVGPGVNPITMSDDGRLFVGRLFLGSGLYEVDADLEDPPVLLDESLNINGFDFGPDGYLYAPAQFTGEIVKIDVDAAMPVGSTTVASGFRAPTAVKFNSSDELHVVDLAEGTVSKLDLASGDRKVLVDIEGTLDNMAFNDRDHLYTAAGADNQIIRRVGHRVKALSKPGFGLPGGVAVSPDGTVWVGDFFVLRGFESHRKRWTTSFYDRFDPPGTAFAGAATVAADGDNVIISSGFANSVQVMDPTTGAILFDTRAVGIPTNAIRHGDALVAANLAAGNVVNAEDPSDVLIGDLIVPLGLASDGHTLYVGDWATGNVWAVTETDTSLLASGLALPEGLAVDGDRLLVAETGLQQVTAIDLATGDISAVVVGLDYTARVPEGFFPYGNMAGVAVGSHGAIYVSDDGVNKVYKFRKRGRHHRHR